MDQFAFYNKTTALRIGLTPTSTLTSSNTSLPGNLTLPGPVVFSGTIAGTNLQLINSTTVSSGTTTTLAYAGLGVTPGTALENLALTSHRWWTGSSGTSSGTISMQLSATNLTLGNSSLTSAIQFAGTTGGTLLQFANTIATISGTVATTAYGAFGMTPGTALERYALNAHRWWTGSSGTTSGTVGMLLNSGGLSLSTITVGTSSAGTTSAHALNVIGSSMFTGIIHQPNIYALQLVGASNNNFQTQAGAFKTFGPGNFTSVAYAYPNSTVWGASNNFPNNLLVIPQNGFYSIYVGFLLGPNNSGNDIGVFVVQSNLKANFMHQTVVTPSPFNYATSVRISAAFTGYFQANEQLTFNIYSQNYTWSVYIDQNSFVSITQVASL